MNYPFKVRNKFRTRDNISILKALVTFNINSEIFFFQSIKEWISAVLPFSILFSLP